MFFVVYIKKCRIFVQINYVMGKMYELRIRIDEDTMMLLQQELKNKYAIRGMSAIVREALYRYFTRSTIPAEVRPPVAVSPEVLKEQMGILKEAEPADTAFIIPSVRPGPGVVRRLAEMGISTKDIILAKRAKAHGREYDVELEKYFDLI